MAIDTTGARALADFKAKRAAAIPGAQSDAESDAAIQAIFAAVLQEVVNYATVTVTSVTGVQPGSGTSGPGTGTVS